MDSIKKRIYISTLALMGALMFAVIFIITRPQNEPQQPTQQPVSTSTAPIVHSSNDSSYTVLALTYTAPWDASCNGLGHGRKIDPIVSIQYPQIQGLENGSLEQHINPFLESEFYVEPLQRAKVTCGTPDNPQYFGETGIDTSFDIKLQTNKYLSIKHSEATGLLSNLRPTYEYKGYTIDMTDGTVMSYKDIFKADVQSRRDIKSLIIAGLPRDMKSNPDVDRDILDYDFYLTKDGVVFFNIFLSPVFQGVEVRLSYEQVKPYLVEILP